MENPLPGLQTGRGPPGLPLPTAHSPKFFCPRTESTSAAGLSCKKDNAAGEEMPRVVKGLRKVKETMYKCNQLSLCAQKPWKTKIRTVSLQPYNIHI